MANHRFYGITIVYLFRFFHMVTRDIDRKRFHVRNGWLDAYYHAILGATSKFFYSYFRRKIITSKMDWVRDWYNPYHWFMRVISHFKYGDRISEYYPHWSFFRRCDKSFISINESTIMNSEQAASLSGMAQSFGYLLAACGPFLLGLLYDLFHQWHTAFFALITIAVLFTLCGIGAGRNVLCRKPQTSSKPLKSFSWVHDYNPAFLLTTL